MPGGAPRQLERTPVVGLANLAPAGGESRVASAAREGGGGGAPPSNPPRGDQRRGTRFPSPRRNQQGGFRAPDPDPSDSDPGSGSDSDSSLSDSGTEADNELSRDAEIRKLQRTLNALKRRRNPSLRCTAGSISARLMAIQTTCRGSFWTSRPISTTIRKHSTRIWTRPGSLSPSWRERPRNGMRTYMPISISMPRHGRGSHSTRSLV